MLRYTVLVTTSSGTTAATFRLQSVFRFVLVLSVLTVFPVFMVLKSIGAGPEAFTPFLPIGCKVTFSHHAVSEILKGNFVFSPWNDPLPHCQG